MAGRRHRLVLAVLVALLLPLPRIASAARQTTGSIAGVVRDATGAVLDNAIVEASSPAMTEKARSVPSDAQGNYKIIDLRPGTYTVTVSLPGFTIFKREGIELSTGFTASVNADLQIGSLDQTVTVTGASPIVDVQNARTQAVLKTETMDQLPSGAKNLMAFAAMTLGAVLSSAGRNDVGGDKGELTTGILLHGGRGDDGRTSWDGMNTNVMFGAGGGGQRLYYFNTVAAQEVVIDTGGANAETETGGPNLNVVPKEGSSHFTLHGVAAYTDSRFSSKAVPDDLKARGIPDQASLRKIYDYGVGVGGPLKRDMLWFYATDRAWGAQTFGANNYFDKHTSPFSYTPDLTRPAYNDSYFADSSFRLTFQAGARHKITHEIHLQHGCACDLAIQAGALTSPDSATDFNYGPQWLNQTTWSYAKTNRLLIQAGATFLLQGVSFVDGVAPNANKFTGAGTPVFPGAGIFSIAEQLGVLGGAQAGYTYGAVPGGVSNYGDSRDDNFNQKVTVSYITGSHAFKSGLQTIQGQYDFTGMEHGVEQVNYVFRGGVPISLTEFAGPFLSKTRLHGEGLFAQDQWTMKRLTLNYGARVDHFNGHTPALDIPAGRFRPAFSVPADPTLPDFTDITYRAGAAYDLFGNGRTAVKGSWGKYLMGQGGSLSQNGFAKAIAIVQNVSRSWFGGVGVPNPATGVAGNGDYIPDCVLENPAANGECGAITNPLFGQPFPFQSLADDVRRGWGHREFNHQWNVQLQQELRPGVGVAAGYFHTQWGNMSVTRNTRVTPDDYTTYCITAPTDMRLGATSGQPICGYYDPTTAGVAKGSAFEVTQASHYGDPKDYFNGVEISVNARWGTGALVTGGVSVGREVFDFCYANGHPELTPQQFNGGTSRAYPRNDEFCTITPPWWSGIGSQVKLQVVYPLPYDIVLGATYKNLPGIPVSATLPLTTAQITSILGRASTAAGSANHALIPVQGTVSATVFDQRLNETDLRFSKIFRMGTRKVHGDLDVYNILNARTPQAIATTYVTPTGGTFERPTALLGGRLFKFGVQVDY